MAGDGGTGARCFRDLPDDILGAIYRHCSSPYDRARFAAVCRSWYAAASWQPKLPALPLLLNSTGNGGLDRKARAYSPEDGRVLCVRLPRSPYGKRIVGSHEGGWVAAAIGCRLDIVNLFTTVSVMYEEEVVTITRTSCYKTSIEKVIFSEDPASEGCIMAVMTTLRTRDITLCRRGGPRGDWMSLGCGMESTLLVDMAFCNGDLYSLSEGGAQLYKLIIDPNKDNPPVVTSLEKLVIQRPFLFNPKYIFELGGKLAIAREVPVPLTRKEARIFRVSELANYTWEEVTSLGDHALFLGPGCCKAVHVSAAGKHGDVERNRIYYSKHFEDNVDSKCLPRLELGSCDVYCYKSDRVLYSERIMSRGYHYREKRGGPRGDWMSRGCGMESTLLVDMAFCNGDLYGLLEGGALFYKLSIDPSKDNPPVVIALDTQTIQRSYLFNPLYIFELGG
ncbi:hypothetical protein ACQ4PT_007447 [Festuca glaucescens]